MLGRGDCTACTHTHKERYLGLFFTTFINLYQVCTKVFSIVLVQYL